MSTSQDVTTAAANQRRFRVEVDGRDIPLGDPVPSARQVLAGAALTPVDEHVLIELLDGRTQSVGLDEEIDLRGHDRRVFRGFRTDRIFRFTIDGTGCEWGDPSIGEPDLRRIAGVNGDRVLLLERADDPDRVLGHGDRVRLADAGTERLRTVSKLVRVFLDDVTEKEIPRGNYTTERLLELLGVAPGYSLNVIDENGQLQPLQPRQTIRIKDGMRFYSQAPGGGAS